MKTRSKPMSRLLSLALCLCMVLALLPAIPLVAQAATASVIYLKPNDWNVDGARFAAYFYGNGEAWVDMTDPDGNGIFECAVPSGFTNVIFCRMAPNTANSWSNKWNQTYDLTVPTTDKVLYSISGWGDYCSGAWNAPSCQEVGHSFVNDVCTRCSAQGRTFYFQNNWLWGDVRVHYWKGDVNNGWPGQSMEYYGRALGLGADEYDHFKLTIPADIDGFIINGIKDDVRVQSNNLSISDWYDGVAYWMLYENEQNKAERFEICKAFPAMHIPETVSGYPATCTVDGLTDGQKCTRCDTVVTAQEPTGALGHSFDETGVCTVCGTGTMKIFFQNNWMWENISLYYWFEGTTLDNKWPGDLMEHYGKATVDFEGGSQEFDYYVLTVPANVAGIIINGVDPSKPEDKQNRQTFEIPAAQLQNGVTFHIDGEEPEAEGRDQWCYVDSFSITKDFPCALGHAEVQHEAQAVTCTEIGWDAYVTCENCDYSTYEEIPAPGHTEVAVPGYAETCGASGMTDGTKCSTCGVPMIAQDEIPATGDHVDEDEKDGRCDLCNELMAPVQLIKTSASLEGNIAVNYFLLLSDEVLADETAYMQFTMADGEIIQVPVKDSKLIDGYDVFTCEVAAKEMTDIITSQFYYGGEAAFEKDHQYNVRAYAKHVMENYDDANTKNLMEAMVNYGAASQAHFGYNTEEPANSILDTKPDYSNMAISGYDVIRGQGTENVKFYSASLILNSETTLRFFFNGNVTATYEGRELPVKYRGGLYYVDVVDIAAKDLDADVTITINDGTQSANITFNPITYCQLILNDTTGAYTTEMRELVYALYLYSQAANAYFVNDGPQGATLYNALRYLNSNGTKITGQVTSVTFGRSNAYRDIANTYGGTLVDVEQDAPAYAYYVPNASGYDVYVLSNDIIYAPANSTNLFASMTKLKTVDTGNFDVSRVTNMTSLFDYCGALQTVDTSDWDTSKVTKMEYMFYGCQSLTELDVSGWDMSSVTSMNQTFFNCTKLADLDVSDWDVSSVDFLYATFYNCSSLTKLDVSRWNTGKVSNMSSLFAKCSNLAELDVSGWNVSKVTSFLQTFAFCHALTELDVSNWDTSSANRMDQMFYTDYNLKYLDVSDWDVSKVTLFNHMFASDNQNQGDMKLNNLDLSKWNPVSAVNMASMFYGCGQLTEINMSGWNMPNLENLTHAFADCYKLEKVVLSGWNTPSLISMDAMFNHCISMKTIDVSDVDTGSVREFSQLFDACSSLEEIKGLENWDTSNGRTFTEMFSGTSSLKTLNLSSFNTCNAYDNYTTLVSGEYPAFVIMFSGMNSLETLIVSDKISYLGNGNVADGNKLVFPAPAAVEGSDGKWYDLKTGVGYLPSEIPEKTEATYVAVMPANP